MEVILGPRGSMCFVGSYSFTFGDPGPKELDPEELTSDELNQLVYNVRREILTVSDLELLTKLTEESVAASKEFATEAERPVTEVIAETFTSQEAIEEDLKELRKILSEPVATVRRQATDLRGGRIRKLLELEETGKDRSSLVKFLKELVAKHSDAVRANVGFEDLQATTPRSEDLYQITDIVESEEKKVILDTQETLNPLPE